MPYPTSLLLMHIHMMQLNRKRPNHHMDKNYHWLWLCVVINKKQKENNIRMGRRNRTTFRRQKRWNIPIIFLGKEHLPKAIKLCHSVWYYKYSLLLAMRSEISCHYNVQVLYWFVVDLREIADTSICEALFSLEFFMGSWTYINRRFSPSINGMHVRASRPQIFRAKG